MMFHSSFSQSSRKTNAFKAKRILLLSVLLGIVLWLSYQVRHSYDAKHEYYRISETNDDGEHVEIYLGRKFRPGTSDGSWEEKRWKEDVGYDVSQIHSDGRDQESLNKEEESLDITENNVTESQHVDEDLHLNSGNNGTNENDEPEKLGESLELTSQKEQEETQESGSGLDEQGSDSKNDTELQEHNADGENHQSEEDSDGVKEDVTEKHNEISDGVASQELGESANHAKDVSTEAMEHIAVETSEHNKEERYFPNDKEHDVPHEEMGSSMTTMADSHDVKGESKLEEIKSDDITQTEQSEESNPDEANSDSQNQIHPSELVASTGEESDGSAAEVTHIPKGSDLDDNGLNTSALGDQQENDKPVENEAFIKEEDRSEGLAEISKVIDETPDSSDAMENHKETSLDSESSSMESGKAKDHASKGEEISMNTNEAAEDKQGTANKQENTESNILMVTDNTTSEPEVQEDGASEVHAVENGPDGENSGVKSDEDASSEEINPSNNEAKTEEKSENEGHSDASGPHVTSSFNESSTEQRKEEF